MSDGTVESTRIRQLDSRTIAKIAAGEVVERPASVVKELVENALDAGASRVNVAITEGGTDGIVVTDNGIGMSEEAVRLAVEQHTTSKIRDVADLESGVSTLGFRGEALHTIGSVARVTIRTRHRDSDVGTELVYHDGEIESVEPTGCPIGTIVSVDELFSNTPARRKFLKSVPTEFSHVNRVVSRYALANHDVAFSLEHDGRSIFSTPGDGALESAVLAVYGAEIARSMMSIDGDATDATDGPIEAISGLVSHPETNRSTAEYLATFVNGRAIRSEAIRSGIMEAYSGQLGSGRYPFVICFVDVPAGSIDVNVHPQKHEVRFDDDTAVREQVRETVKATLIDHGLIRTRAPRGRSAPAETPLEPIGDEPETQDKTSPSTVDDSTAQQSTTSTNARTESKPTIDDTPRSSQPSRESSDGRDRTPSVEEPTQVDDRKRSETSIRDAPDQQTLDGGSAKIDRRFDTLPSLEVLGQLHDTFLVCETAEGLLLIDQHAADERVNYERLRRSFETDNTTQRLAQPVEVELTAAERETFQYVRNSLEGLGFVAEIDESNAVRVTGVPSVIDTTVEPNRLRDVLSSFVSGGRTAADETIDTIAAEFLADLACYPSVTGNTSLTEGSVSDLLDALDACENPFACPHGRPVIIELNRDEIDDRFERDYPGHGG